MENKKSFFSIGLKFDEGINQLEEEKIDHNIDIIISAMNSRSDNFKFRRSDNKELVYLFKTETRKRNGQLVKLLEKNLSENDIYYSNALTKIDYETEIARLKNNPNFTNLMEPDNFSHYKGTDIKFLEDRRNWYPWQHEVWEMIFDENNKFKKPDERKIISIVDYQGNQGKSKFWKMLTVKNLEKVGRLGYGTASQLRSAAIGNGNKELFIIDLARAKGSNDSQRELLSVIEDIKGGLVFSPMYGSSKILLTDPPHVIISSNYKLDYNLLSSDRWSIFELRNKKLKEIKNLKTKIKLAK